MLKSFLKPKEKKKSAQASSTSPASCIDRATVHSFPVILFPEPNPLSQELCFLPCQRRPGRGEGVCVENRSDEVSTCEI